MPSNFSAQETVSEIVESDTKALHETEAFVRFYWTVFVQEPSNTSLATLYGALLALASSYKKVGCVKVIPKLLAKLEPALFHILEHTDHFCFEQIYPHIDMLICVGDFSRAKKVAQQCIKIIMSKNTDLTLAARRDLRELLQHRFMSPIEERLKWHEDSLQLMDSMDLPAQWFEIAPREDGLLLIDHAYEVVYTAWKESYKKEDESDGELTA